jgi:hypothetical protein
MSQCPALLQILSQDEKDNFEADMVAGKYMRPKYVGECNAKGQKHGKGALYWLNGSVYEGEFANDKQNGHGKHVTFAGDTYVGRYENDQYEEGVYTWADGGTYSGTFKKDRFHGHGVRVFPEGSRHEGNYENGKRNGKGKLFHSDGSIFDGEFRNELRFKGQLTYPNGDIYEGGFENEVPHGKGKLTKADGSVKSGNFNRGVFVGNKPVASSLLISDLTVGATHNGRYLDGTISSDPFKMNAIQLTIKDDAQNEITTSVYNYPGYGGSFGMTMSPTEFSSIPARLGLTKGKKIRIRDPYCKIAMDGQVVIRVDDWGTIEYEGKVN